MKILALELSSAVGSVAFRAPAGGDFVRQFPSDRKHSGLFFENLSTIVSACGLPDRIAVGLGPGSYAGTRIAIATALGLKTASHAQLVGLPSICGFDAEEYCVIGDARRNSFFYARVSHGRCEQGPDLMKIEQLIPRIAQFAHLPLFASAPVPEIPRLTIAWPSAGILARLAEDPALGAAETLEPMYLREPYITKARHAVVSH